jgi:hypothetical protein
MIAFALSAEWAGPLAEAVGAVGTLLAVLAALFGPQFHAWRRRPLVTLEGFRVRNERGRDTARDVEVFITAAKETWSFPDGAARERYFFEEPGETGSIDSYVAADNRNLPFDPPSTQASCRSMVNIAAGHWRDVYLLVDGMDAEAVLETLGVQPDTVRMPRNADTYAALAVCRRTAEESVAWLENGVEYDVELLITGANFDAVRYRAKIRSFRRKKSGATASFTGWSEVPRRVPPEPWKHRFLHRPDVATAEDEARRGRSMLTTGP